MRRERQILATVHQDGRDVAIWIEQESRVVGKELAEYTVGRLAG